MLKKLYNLLKKKKLLEKDLAKELNLLIKLKEEREQRIGEVAADGLDRNILSDREVKSYNRRIRSTEDRISNLKSAINALNGNISKEGECLHHTVIQKLQIEAGNTQKEFNQANQQHLQMVRAANEFRDKVVTPAHQKKDRAGNVFSNYQSNRSGWGGEKIVAAVSDPSLFLGAPHVAEVLGLGDELARLKAQKEKEEKIEREKRKKKRAQEIKQNREYLDRAILISQGKKAAPEDLQSLISSGDDVGMIIKLLKQYDNSNVNGLKKEGVV